MKKLGIICLVWLALFTQVYGTAISPERKPNRYQFSVDLTKVKDDKLTVNLITPNIRQKEIVYYMPKIVPGTYANYDFGRFVSDFTARDKRGRPLPVEQIDQNSWRIKDARKLNRITYTVEDTWDAEDLNNFVFEPSGTNIEEGKNFVLNNHGFFGYFEGMKRVPYEITFTKPEGFYGSTSLVPEQTTPTADTYLVDNYMNLVDAPIMYNRPDTTVLKIGGADILVSIYSPNKAVSSKEIAENLDGMLEAQKEYLGGKLPIQKYAFLIYLFDKPTRSGSMGALEHSYSSLYTLPEVSAEQLSQTVRDVASHEFFHILTPLSIHSEQIHNFDFNKPEMSKHLWLYEGITEYFAGHMQVTQGLIDPQMYIGMLMDKIRAAEQFNDTLPFTQMSKNVLEQYKEQYPNVYQKGALIGMALDIRLRELSQGKYGLMNLMQDLSKKFGPEQPFKDEQLFDVIAQMTYPEIRTFFTRYVEGSEPLPLEELFSKVGFDYQETLKTKVASLGRIQPGFNPETGRVIIQSTENMNEFGKAMGYKDSDEIISLNGTTLTASNFSEVLTDFISNTKEGDKVAMVVARKDEGGKEAQVELSAPALLVETEQRHVIQPVENPSAQQQALQHAWLGKGK